MGENSYILDKKEKFDSLYCGEEIIDLLSQTFRIPEDFGFNIFETTEEHICRPDILSYDAYGTTRYADLLLKLNNIHPFELNAGMYVIIPNFDYLEKFEIVPAKSTLVGIDTGDFIPMGTNPMNTKYKQRSTNDALMNSSRYKINPATGVITY